MRKAPTILADVLIDLAAETFAQWLAFQWRMREIAKRSNWLHGGGVQGIVLFHDPEAIR